MTMLDPRIPASPSDPKLIVEKGCSANNIEAVKTGLQAAADQGKKDISLLSSALRTATSAGNVATTKYLLEQEHAPIDALSPLSVAQNASPELLQLLVDHGFDVNEPASLPMGRGPYLLQRVCHDETLTRWCLDHGAKVDSMAVDPYHSPPILQSVASMGSVPTFKLLLERGAKLDGRILHVAAGNVGSRPDTDREYFKTRMAMVKYLVEEVGLDVNEMDSEESMGNYWGTPICYAARNPFDCAEVVRYLLEKGADPEVVECMEGVNDAFSYAEQACNTEIMKGLEEWRSRQPPR
ncbi:ankyrin repeat-containing domain protein [Amylocarpus encephaloides]|uniref:Ankyrin repeat-containing domain protein n=1 Tax=Amylocarpus encephaloides TaxID=45428 RepID=A0A9P7YG21_9HELO|nr:ankyrin repeat-containing domain protein [Amylocarpus encephaloides]